MLINCRSGFTIVELAIVITVIGILATVGTVGYRGLNTRADNTKTQDALLKAKEFVETKDIASGLYPTAMTGFTTDQGTTLTYMPSSDRKSYCLSAASIKSNTKVFKVAQEGKVTEGTCVPPQFNGPVITGAFQCFPDYYDIRGQPRQWYTWNSEAQTTYPSFVPYITLYDENWQLIGDIDWGEINNDLITSGEFTFDTGSNISANATINVRYKNASGTLSEESEESFAVENTGTCPTYET